MIQEFARSIEVNSPQREVWETLLEIQKVASWIPIVGSVQELRPLARYKAVLEDRLGPFRLRADLEIEIQELIERRVIRARATGEDRQISSRITIEGTLGLEPLTSGTTIEIAGRYEVTGRVATLGAGSIRKKAGSVLDDFFARASDELGGTGATTLAT